MSKAKGLSAWNSSREFVFKGNIVPRSHMLDLIKNVTNPQKVRDDRRPVGWSKFLQAFAELNIPFSTVPNHHVKRMINFLRDTSLSTPSTGARSKRKNKRHLRTSSPRSAVPQSLINSPSNGQSGWRERHLRTPSQRSDVSQSLISLTSNGQSGWLEF